jgi:hypothetical protein
MGTSDRLYGCGQRDVRQPLETFDVVALLHDARRQADEREISRGVDSEHRAARAHPCKPSLIF